MPRPRTFGIPLPRRRASGVGGHPNLPAGGQQSLPVHSRGHLVTQGAGGRGHDSRAGAALDRHFRYAPGRSLPHILGRVRGHFAPPERPRAVDLVGREQPS